MNTKYYSMYFYILGSSSQGIVQSKHRIYASWSYCYCDVDNEATCVFANVGETGFSISNKHI